jgi:hypothetical protein
MSETINLTVVESVERVVTINEGTQGPAGAAGAQGAAGQGVPTGGTTGQILKKASNTNYDTTWANETGAVSSVNSQTGAVVLTTSHIAEGTNQYWTDNRFDTRFTTAFDLKTTSDLDEGANLYFTQARTLATPLTGYSAGAGTVAATDTILQAMNKLGANDTARVVGPSSATDEALARFDGTTGKLVQDSLVFANDAGRMKLGSAALVQQASFQIAVDSGFGDRSLVFVNGSTVLGQIGVALTAGRFASDAAVNDMVLRPEAGEMIFSDPSGNRAVSFNTTRVLFSKPVTSPSSGTRTERFGSGADATQQDGVAIGYNALVTTAGAHKGTAIGATAVVSGDSGTAIGYDSQASTRGTAIGRGTRATAASDITAIGYGAAATAVRAMAIGSLAAASADSSHVFGNGSTSSHQASICIGYAATSTAANQLVIGGVETRAISEAYIGSGVTSTAPVSTMRLQSSGGSGSNVAGTSVILAAGRSTGNATPAYVAIQSTTVGSSGTTAQTLVERFRADGTGIGFFAVTPVARQTGGAATAGASYTATEQTMINAMYTALRNYGLLT